MYLCMSVLTVPYPYKVCKLMVVFETVVYHIPELLIKLFFGSLFCIYSPPEPVAASFVERAPEYGYACGFEALKLMGDKVDIVYCNLIFLCAGSYCISRLKFVIYLL